MHVKTKVRPLFPGFSHCACLPLLSNPRPSSSTTSTAACPKNPSTCSKRASLFIQKFSRQHFPLLCCRRRRRSPDVPFLPPFAPAPRAFSATPPRLVSSRLIVADAPHPRTLLQTSHKLSIDPDHRHIHTSPPARSLRFLSLTPPPPPTSFHMYV